MTDDMVYFKNYHKELAARFISADFEAIDAKVYGCQPNNDESYTKHIRSIKTVDMAIRLSVIMMISIVNQFRYVEENILFINSWKKC